MRRHLQNDFLATIWALGYRFAKAQRIACPGARAHRATHHLFSSRMTNRSPDHVSSIAHTLLSTRPVGRATNRMKSAVISVGTFDAFFGQATQNPAAGVMRRLTEASWRANSARRVRKSTRTSDGSFPVSPVCKDAVLGNTPSVFSKSLGGPRIATRWPSLMPSFFGSGVPEYPATSSPRWRRCGRGWDRLAINGIRLHQLNPRAVGAYKFACRFSSENGSSKPRSSL